MSTSSSKTCMGVSLHHRDENGCQWGRQVGRMTFGVLVHKGSSILLHNGPQFRSQGRIRLGPLHVPISISEAAFSMTCELSKEPTTNFTPGGPACTRRFLFLVVHFGFEHMDPARSNKIPCYARPDRLNLDFIYALRIRLAYINPIIVINLHSYISSFFARTKHRSVPTGILTLF